MKKIISVIATLAFLITLPLGEHFAKAEESSNKETINLEDFDLSNLEPGDVIEAGDLTITQYTDEEAAKIISKETGKSEKEVLNNLSCDNSLTESKPVSRSVSTLATKKCATGATAFSRSLNVASNYKPTLNVWTELCQNSAGQYVVKSIVDISMNRNYNGTVKHFNGGLAAKALNSGKTLYYRAEGDFFNKGTTTIGGGTGLNTAVASVDFSVSKSSNHFGYIHQTDNIILFK